MLIRDDANSRQFRMSGSACSFALPLGVLPDLPIIGGYDKFHRATVLFRYQASRS